MDFADLNGDGRTDIVSTAWPGYALALYAPASPEQPWQTEVIGSLGPDQLISVRLADIDGDQDLDLFVGAYSRGPRDRDGDAVTRNDPVGRIAWFERRDAGWLRHDISRRKRGMFDKWLAHDFDGDGDIDFAGTRGNSEPFDGVFWLEQVRDSSEAVNPRFTGAWPNDSQQLPLPD